MKTAAVRTILSCLLLFFLFGARAEPDSPIARQALFERGIQSLPFLMTMASLDPDFRKWLESSPTEILTFQALSTIAHDVRNRQWLREKGVPIFTVEKNDASTGEPRIWETYYHVPFADPQTRRSTPKFNRSPIRFGLQFSNDRSKFDIDGSERAAMTHNELDADIFVNLHRINETSADPSQPRTFANVIGLLLHEMGHKIPALGMQKDLSRINNVAARIEAFVKSRTITFETSSGKVHVLPIKNAFFEQWVKQTLTAPNPNENLAVYDNEGLIVFFENERGLTDLTSEVLAPLTAQKLLSDQIDPRYYVWTRLNWVLASVVQVSERADGKISLSFNTDQAQLALPFMRKGDPDPREFPFWQRFFPTTPPLANGLVGRHEAVIDASGAHPRVVSHLPRTLTLESAQIEVKKISVEWQGSDLVARYRLPKDILATRWEGGEVHMRPFLMVRLNGQLAEIASSQTSSVDGEFEFRLPQVQSANTGVLEIVGMEIGRTRPNLAVGGEPRGKLFLSNQERIQLKGTHTPAPARFVGLTVVEASSGSKHPHGETLRLEFESETYLLSLKLLYEYNWRAHVPKGGELVAPKLRRTRWVTIEPTMMKQKLNGRLLSVEIPIDGNVDTEVVFSDLSGVKRPAWAPPDVPVFKPGEITTVRVGNARLVKAVEFTTQSLQSGLANFEKPAVFGRARVPFCRALFLMP